MRGASCAIPVPGDGHQDRPLVIVVPKKDPRSESIFTCPRVGVFTQRDLSKLCVQVATLAQVEMMVHSLWGCLLDEKAGQISVAGV